MRFGITLSSFLEVLARLKCCWSFCFRKVPCRERTRTKDMIVAGFGHELFFFVRMEVMVESLTRAYSEFPISICHCGMLVWS